MADENIQVGEVPASRDSQAVESKESGSVQTKGWLKGSLLMAICCAAPLILLAAIPFLVATFGSVAAVGSGLLTVVALLACSVGMFLLMRMIMKNQK